MDEFGSYDETTAEEFDDTCEADEFEETTEITDVDLNDSTADLTEALDCDTEQLEVTELEDSDTLTAAELAAEYARSKGFDKAADYISRHYIGDEYTPGDIININTRNQALEGDDSLDGVTFNRQDVELTEGLTVNGVFPEFDSIYHVELGENARDMSNYKQFKACKELFQRDMFQNNKELLKGFTIGDMDVLESTNAPEGCTWNHNVPVGSFDLVKSDVHSIGHTGGNAMW